MIEGLKVRISSQDLRDLLSVRVMHHTERAAFYRESMERFVAGTQGDAMPQMTGGNPIDGMRTKEGEHTNLAAQFKFIHDHIVTDDFYQLSDDDLFKLEILKRRY